ncbi:MAG: hypothetical protein AAFP24_02545 [Pseudomonadota bacterium]
MSASLFLKQIPVALLAVFLFASPGLAQETETDPLEVQNDAAPSMPVSDERLDSALAALSSDDGLQTERPEWTPEPEENDPRRDRSGPNPIAEFFANLLQAIGPLLGYLLAALIIVAILAGLYMVFGESITLRGKQKEAKDAPDVSNVPDLRPAQAQARALLEDADALAAQGRFAEAVHLLLFRSIDDIQAQRNGVIDRSLTSREIGALGVLPTPVRDALLPIIRIVERSFFGGQAVTKQGWSEARASYERFAFGEAWA